MAAQVFVRPQNFDSATVRVRDRFVSLRDTLHSVTAGAARLERDLRTASDQVLISRARLLRDVCSGSLKGVDGTRDEMFAGTPVTKVPAPKRTALDRSFIQLRAALNQCSIDFAELAVPGMGPRIRDGGVSRILPSETAIRDIESAGDVFLRSLGVRIRPYGAAVSPLAGGGSAGPR